MRNTKESSQTLLYLPDSILKRFDRIVEIPKKNFHDDPSTQGYGYMLRLCRDNKDRLKDDGVYKNIEK